MGFKVQQRFAVLKGQLYLPLNLPQEQLIPEWVNLKRRLGTWGTEIPKSDFYRLERHEWLCPHQKRVQTLLIGGLMAYIVKILMKPDFICSGTPFY